MCIHMSPQAAPPRAAADGPEQDVLDLNTSLCSQVDPRTGAHKGGPFKIRVSTKTRIEDLRIVIKVRVCGGACVGGEGGGTLSGREAVGKCDEQNTRNPTHRRQVASCPRCSGCRTRASTWRTRRERWSSEWRHRGGPVCAGPQFLCVQLAPVLEVAHPLI